MKWVLFSAAIASLAFLPTAQAEEENNEELAMRAEPFSVRKQYQDQDGAECCDASDKAPKRMTQQKRDGDWGAKMPAAHGCSSNEGFVFSMEYLIMRSYQPNLAYAFEKKNAFEFRDSTAPGAGVIGGISLEGTMVRPVRTWRPGFKLNMGWNTAYDLWDVQSEWMYYYNKSVTNKSTDDMALNASQPVAATFSNLDEGFVPYWALPIVNSGGGDLFGGAGAPAGAAMATYTQMQGVWQLNYNMLNLELGRSIYITKALALRPHFGLQNGWIHQKVAVEYARSLTVIPTEADQTRPLDQLVQLTNKFWGIGFRTGMGGEWQLGAGFSVLGRVAGSILSGRTIARRIQKSEVNATLSEIGDADYVKIHNISDRIRDFSPSLESSLGLTWGTCMGCDDGMYFGLTLAWESIYWWNQFRFLQPELRHNYPTDTPPTRYNYRSGLREDYPFRDEALNIEGFTARAKFDF